MTKNENNKTFVQRVRELWNKIQNYKFIKIIFKFMPQNIFMFFLMLLNFAALITFSNNDYVNAIYTQIVADSTYNLIVDQSVDIPLSNVSTSKDLANICIRFSTNSKKTDSLYKYIIKNQNEIVYEEEFNSNTLKDGAQKCFDISMVNKEQLENHTVSIVPISTDENNAITILKNNATDEAAYIVTSQNNLLSLKDIMLVIFILIYFGLNYIIDNKKISYERFWLIILVTLIIPLSILIPAYQVPDEPFHFNVAYNLSSKLTFKNNKDMQGVLVPENINCLNYTHVGVLNKITDYKDVTECLKSAKNVENKEIASAYASKYGYFASSIGIKLADIFSNSPLIIFYAGRLFNVLILGLIIYFALKIAPNKKGLILSIATIPMFLQQLCSYSYDAVIFAISILVFSIIMNMIYNKKTPWLKFSIILLICSYFICKIKPIYCSLFLLLLFIPDDKFKKKYYKYLYCVGIIVVPFALNYLISLLGSDNAVVVSQFNENFSRVLSNPLSIIPIAMKTLSINGEFYIRGMIGYFGWFCYHLNDIFIFIYAVYFIYLLKHETILKVKWYDKFILIIGLLLSIGAIFAAMYFCWYPSAGLDYVEGVQGRYFIPLIIYTLAVFIPYFNSEEPVQQINEKIPYYFVIILILQYIGTLLLFHY